jgi:DeoR/GlpR family transcriptional regulator of sugar metabolism
MIKAASETAILTIAEKLNSFQKMKVCGLADVKYMITDLDRKHETFAEYSKKVKLI